MFQVYLNELLSSKNVYDNQGAYQTLQDMMNRKEVINVKFFADKEGYPCAWIESRDVAGFKYRLKGESLKGILHYINKGEVSDFDADPRKIEKVTAHTYFQLNRFTQCVGRGRKIQYVPLVREANGYVSASNPFFKGKIFFRVERTSELLDYLRENKQAI